MKTEAKKNKDKKITFENENRMEPGSHPSPDSVPKPPNLEPRPRNLFLFVFNIGRKNVVVYYNGYSGIHVSSILF